MHVAIKEAEDKLLSLYWPNARGVLQDIRDHAHACRLRADAGVEPWGRLAAFAARMTRRSVHLVHEESSPREEGQALTLSFRMPNGTNAAILDLLHTLIMEGV